jgi:pyruvate/2-oxoglutarate dehydrogenase complex dihydrolipoamide dehydrogenase (E3) component
VRTSYDVIIIGGGSGGLVAAQEARRRGATTLIVQKGRIGGDCTFTGCVPSKTLLAATASGADFDTAMRRVHDTIEHIARTEDAAALARDGIDVVDGFARFVSPTEIEVDGRRLRSRRFVVATGARPVVPPIPGLRDLAPLTSDDLFGVTSRPESLVILGGGPIGCEMAQAWARLGTDVTLVEGLERVLPREEPEASAAVTRALTAAGVHVVAGSPVASAGRSADGDVELVLDDGRVIVAEQILVAVGRAPSGRGFGLEEIGVELDERGAVIVDAGMATNVDGVWAVGDVTGGLQFTHAAGRMGWVAASNALSKLGRIRAFRFDTTAVPWATFTTPEVGRVGLTEAEAAERFPSARVAHQDLCHVDRAVTAGLTDGFVKLIAAPRRGIGHLGGGRLVGATVVAPTGGELIHEAALAMQTKMFVGRLAQTTHAYPTWSMAIQQAALQFFGPVAGQRARLVQR